MLAGNDNWRSPEGHFKGELNKPSDVYSFGLVVSAQSKQNSLIANTSSASTLFSDVLY